MKDKDIIDMITKEVQLRRTVFKDLYNTAITLGCDESAIAFKIALDDMYSLHEYIKNLNKFAED